MLDMKYLSLPPGGGSLYSSFEETVGLRIVDAQTVMIKKLQMALALSTLWKKIGRGKGKKMN